MAKKFRKSTVVIIDKFLESLYQNGLLHSFIINSSIILILGLMASNYHKISQPILITFASLEEHIALENDTLTSIELESIQPDSDESESMIETSSYIPDMQNDESIEITQPEIDSPQPTQILVNNIVQESEVMVEMFTTQTKTRDKAGSSDNRGRNSSGKGQETLRRLSEAGAQTGDVQISIAWDNYNDIDLWVVLENQYGEFLINWTNRNGPGNGMLDVDRNVRPITNQAVENIFWPHGLAPEGKYTVYIQHYWQWDKQDATPVFLRVLVDGQVTEKMVSVSRSNGVKKVYSFYRKTPQKNQDYSPIFSGSAGPHLPIGQLWSGQ